MVEQVRILIVDDSEDDRDHCEELLEEDPDREWLITETGDSVEGLRLVEDHRFDCVLLDYSMPGLNGIAVMNRLREKNAEVPVVMLTGQGTERIAVEAMKAGAQDYIPKQDLAFPRLAEVIVEAIDQKQKQLDILQRANYDHLTGLAGRALFEDRLHSAIVRNERYRTAFALLFIDLDRFKAVNDTMGHKFGDLLLKEVAERMRCCNREGDTVARLGGDEFVLIFEDLPDDGVATTIKMMERIVEKVANRPYALGGQEITIGTSIGAAICPTTAQDKKGLIEAADLAMYDAKRDPDIFYKIAEPREQTD